MTAHHPMPPARTHTESLPEKILDALPPAILAVSFEGRILYANRAAESLGGCAPGELCGRRWDETALTGFGRWENLKAGIGHSGGATLGAVRAFGLGGEAVIVTLDAVFAMPGPSSANAPLPAFCGMVGRSPRMRHLCTEIEDLARNDFPVHLTGETGTGKELVATAIHRLSRRQAHAFVPLNCAALPEGTLESELFGHVRGAFTGALRDKRGRFELAHRGTLFLDEVADLPRPIQAKLLRVLQEGTFEPVGGEGSRSVDVRIISATNRDLKQEVGRGNFREDLYYRLNVVPLRVPPLRERREDIPLLIRYFLETAAPEGFMNARLAPPAEARMQAYPWPGNVRELQSAVRFALFKSRGGDIDLEHLPLELREWSSPPEAVAGRPSKLTIQAVREALTRTGGNKAKTARLLGVGRATLYRCLRRNGL